MVFLPSHVYAVNIAGLRLLFLKRLPRKVSPWLASRNLDFRRVPITVFNHFCASDAVYTDQLFSFWEFGVWGKGMERIKMQQWVKNALCVWEEVTVSTLPLLE